MVIREIKISDAEAFLRMRQQLDEETEFMLLEPGERQTTVAEERQSIESFLEPDNCTILVAEVAEELVGYVSAEGGAYKRNQHAAHIVIGLLKGFTGQGIGTSLLNTLDEWAAAHNIHRLELTVMVHNNVALIVYHRQGYEIEGLRRHALKINNVYIDEYYLAKFL